MHRDGGEYFRFQKNVIDGRLSGSDSLNFEIWWVKLLLPWLSFTLVGSRRHFNQ